MEQCQQLLPSHNILWIMSVWNSLTDYSSEHTNPQTEPIWLVKCKLCTTPKINLPHLNGAQAVQMRRNFGFEKKKKIVYAMKTKQNRGKKKLVINVRSLQPF